ncbi:MAG: hypothetical protein EZS28_028747, partial [Streblomastix strix]
MKSFTISLIIAGTAPANSASSRYKNGITSEWNSFLSPGTQRHKSNANIAIGRIINKAGLNIFIIANADLVFDRLDTIIPMFEISNVQNVIPI